MLTGLYEILQYLPRMLSLCSPPLSSKLCLPVHLSISLSPAEHVGLEAYSLGSCLPWSAAS